MINASDPLGYTPSGQLTVKNHPESKESDSCRNPDIFQSIISEKLKNLNVGSNSQKEFWNLRDDSVYQEEELYCSGKLAVHSKGSAVNNTKQISYCCETNISHAVWCSFYVEDKNQISKCKLAHTSNSRDTKVGCICLFDAYTLKVFTESGESYVSSLQFKVSSVWATKFGLLLEKFSQPTSSYGTATLDSIKNFSTLEDAHLPLVYSLTHPLDDFCPVLIKHGTTSCLWDASLRIIFTNIEPSFAFVYDTKTGLHSIYKIRKTSMEECQFINTGVDNTSLVYNSIFSPSMHQQTTSSALGVKGSANKTFFNNLGTSGSPFHSKTTSYATSCSANISLSSQPLSRSHSPMATISRCQSPTNPIFSTMVGTPTFGNSNKSHQTLLALSLGKASERTNVFSTSRPINQMSQFSTCSFSGMIVPEICLEHVWTENINQTKESSIEQASRIFLTTDVIGQTYFCYAVTSQFRLYLVRLEKSNDPEQIILGMVTTITAKDAINLPKLNMMAVMELNGNVTIYSGASFVGKLNIPSIPSNVVGQNFTLPNFYGRELLSPYPKRSSLISPSTTSTPEIKFDDGVHLLSPVGAGRANLVDTSITDNPTFLKNAVGNKLVLEYGDNSYFKVSLPTLKASPLVSKCLKTLRYILPRDMSMQLLIKWYVARNAPGPEDLTIEQEWNLFLIIFFTLFGYDINKLPLIMNHDFDVTSEHCSPIIVSKKQKTTNNGSANDWAYLLKNPKTRQVRNYLSEAIGLSKWNQAEDVDAVAVSVSDDESTLASKINIQSPFVIHLPQVLFSLHLLYEELKINCSMSENLLLLARLLYQLSMDLNLSKYILHYCTDFPILAKGKSQFQISDIDANKIVIPNFISANTPDIFKSLFNLFMYSKTPPYPFLPHVNSMCKDLIQLFATLYECNQECILELDNFLKVVGQSSCQEKSFIKKNKKELMEDIIMRCHKMGINKYELDNLPAGINFIFSNIIYHCRERPPSNWPSLVYELIDRQDLAALEKKIGDKHFLDHDENKYINSNHTFDSKDCNDGMEFDYTVLRLRFNLDYRVREVRALLDSSEPIAITIVQRQDVSDHEFIEEQEKHLYALCTRTMALPIGRGMFTLRTSMPINTEQLPIPRLCLTGKAPPRGTTVELTHIEVPSNMNLWPLFHNGVATGLCIHPSASNVDSTWIVYNKQQQGEFGIEHSGFLMALGLNGHLKNLAPFSMYEYLVECHEATSVGLLLGLSATHRSTMDVSMTKLLSLHVETLLPPTSIELNVQQNVQVAALMGVGLVYQETNHRHIAHALLSEIGRPPGPEMKNCVDRESYSLTAGMALGLVVLCSGGGSDLASIPDTLHYYMVGGHMRPFCGSQKDKYKSPSYQIREGDSINIDVTSPGATIALGLMYLKTGNNAVAEWMAAPNTQYLLDFVRPDLLMLRILAKSLILWDSIEPSKTWVSSHVPEIVAKYKLQKPNSSITELVDLETINQAYCNIIAGACMALGLKYAGTENVTAFNTLYHFLRMFMALSTKSVSELAGKATIETCLNVVLLAASIVMAGTGNLDVLRVCRHIRTRVGPNNSVVTYGSHVATHMALGFLFLGGGSYTLSNDPASIAALIIALFPKFPTHSNDNRYHLQALRHFYVLATEPRLLLPRDIDNGRLCYAKIKVTFASNIDKAPVVLKAPCLLPQLDRLYKVELDDDRYWKITFDKNRNFDQLKRILSANCVLNVKQKAGCLSHMEDPQGFRTLLAQTLTTEDAIVWTASMRQITSFTSNSTILNFVDKFLKRVEKPCEDKCDKYCMNDVHNKFGTICSKYQKNATSDNLGEICEIILKVSDSESYFLQNLINITYECVVKDKISFLPLWLKIKKTISTIEKHPKAYLIWQIKFLYSSRLYASLTEKSDNLLSAENIIAIKQCLHSIMDSWEPELQANLHQFTKTRATKAKVEEFEKMISFILNYNVPIDLNNLKNCGKDNMFQNKSLTCTETAGAYKLYEVFNST